MALREIRTFDDSVLRLKCKPVEQVNDRIRTILDDMVETLHNTPNGGALAANQIGILRRLVVIDLGDGVIKLINPVILWSDGEQFEPEACLSFPGLWGRVRRPQSVVVKALDENGCEIEIKASDLMAKCLCHEIDHLDGIVFTHKAEEMNED
ncbi:peptide deformylase [Lacrimispora brassicae]